MTTQTADAIEPSSSEAAGGPHRQIVTFKLADEEYGVDIMHVQEIILIGHITEMPQVPAHVRGLINLRGHVIPIVDLRARMELEGGHAPAEHARIIVFNVLDRTMGVTVDAVDEVMRINDADIEPAPNALCGDGAQYVSGVIKFKERLVILLNIEALVATETGMSIGEPVDA